ncbi:MAG TPA: transporter [Acidobacteriota bacterium]|nr:transporter [Acidobacteriota bacterium]
MKKIVMIICAALFMTKFLHANENEIKWGPIQDNSFLLEEAYNQEYGVIQHISAYRLFDGGSWLYTFTQEWPVPGQKHQLSFTIPFSRVDFTGGEASGLSDLVLNYRYQLVGNGETNIALAPRFSVLLSTGDERKGLGSGGTGFQVNLPLSAVLHPQLVAHMNVGFTHFPSARDEFRDKASTTNFNVGQSFIWQVTMRFNILFEVVLESLEPVIAPNRTERTNEVFISPGVRWAHNFKNGLQIVPGIAFPIRTQSENDNSVFLYLSFEHPLWK